jgi:signal transduction histidine kinase
MIGKSKLTSSDDATVVAGPKTPPALRPISIGGHFREIDQADRTDSESLSILAHELRDPVAVIRYAVVLLRLHGEVDPKISWAVDVIDRQLTQVMRLVDDLARAAGITDGKRQLTLECLDLVEVVRIAAETSRPLIEAGGHELILLLPEEKLDVTADRVRLYQMLANLLTNATKYTPQGGSVWLTAERAGNEAVFRVRDNGIGISSDMLPKVFNLHTQVEHSLHLSHGGQGIGLAVVKRLVEMHGGSVTATSGGPNCGSEFSVGLPLSMS